MPAGARSARSSSPAAFMLTSSRPGIGQAPPPAVNGVSARPTAVRWRILGWIVVASVTGYLLRFNLSVAAPSMVRDLGLSEAQLGVVLGAFAWSYGLCQGPAGVWGE